MDKKIYYNAKEVASMLGVSMGKSYKILREMNTELAGKGFLTIPGKIPAEYTNSTLNQEENMLKCKYELQ